MTTEQQSEDPRALIARACHVLADNGQADMVWGHVSTRDESGRGIWMKAHAFGFDEIAPEHVLLLSLDGEVLSGSGRRHFEFPIHTEIMRRRDDVNCVVHTHSAAAVAFAATGASLRPISHDACLFVPPDIVRFTRTGDLISTRELGEELATTLGERNAALIPNHGIVVAADSVPHAIMATVLLDRACRTAAARRRGRQLVPRRGGGRETRQRLVPRRPRPRLELPLPSRRARAVESDRPAAQPSVVVVVVGGGLVWIAQFSASHIGPAVLSAMLTPTRSLAVTSVTGSSKSGSVGSAAQRSVSISL